MSNGNFPSIAPYLPLQFQEGSLQWKSSTEHVLKAVARGPDTSAVNSALELCDCIEDIRNENGNFRPLSDKIFAGLSRLCSELDDEQEFFKSTVPSIAKLALQLPDLLERHERERAMLADVNPSSMALRVLSPQQPGMVLLHQHLIAALLACSFFCLYPEKPQKQSLLVNINFDGLYLGVVHTRTSNVQKLLCLLHYFKRVGRNMPEGTVSFERKVLCSVTGSLSLPNGSLWSESKETLCEMRVINDGSLVDAGSDYLQVDFANEQLGGGALHTGCVQEEIRFMVSPECIAGMLFLPTMADNESIEITGAETYSQHTGYGKSFCFAGDHEDNTPRDSWGRRKTCICAIDALCLPGESQFEDEFMIRELNKAYCGFLRHSALCGYGEVLDGGLQGNSLAILHSQESQVSVPYSEDNYEIRLSAESDDITVSASHKDENKRQERNRKAESTGSCVMHQKLSGVATGNWGAGAFGGNLELKSLLQWLAASQAGCSIVLYHSFRDVRAQRLQEVINWIQKEGWCVSELWSIVQWYGKCRINRQVKSELYGWILPQENKELFIKRSKSVSFVASSSQKEREDLRMQTKSGRRQLTREVAPQKKTFGCCSWSRGKRSRGRRQ